MKSSSVVKIIAENIKLRKLLKQWLDSSELDSMDELEAFEKKFEQRVRRALDESND